MTNAGFTLYTEELRPSTGASAQLMFTPMQTTPSTPSGLHNKPSPLLLSLALYQFVTPQTPPLVLASGAQPTTPMLFYVCVFHPLCICRPASLSGVTTLVPIVVVGMAGLLRVDVVPTVAEGREVS